MAAIPLTSAEKVLIYNALQAATRDHMQCGPECDTLILICDAIRVVERA